FIRTIGLARAEAKLTLANIAYNFDRLIFHERRRAMGWVRLTPPKPATIHCSAPDPRRSTRRHAQHQSQLTVLADLQL
ncbi:MAG: hypothetical protein AAGI28_16215, partial [Pseudomonadota bacterium]